VMIVTAYRVRVRNRVRVRVRVRARGRIIEHGQIMTSSFGSCYLV
jgi:hypothetical protein